MHFNRDADFDRAYTLILGPAAAATSLSAPPETSPLVAVLTAVLTSTQAMNTDYYQVLESRHRDLVLNADMDTSEDHLRQFLFRWNDATLGAASQEILAGMRLAILHYLGHFDEARRILRTAIPSIFGGESSTGFITAFQAESTIAAHQASSQTLLAERSVGQCFLANDWQFGKIVLKRIRDVIPGYPNQELLAKTTDAWQLIVWIANIAEHCEDLTDCYDQYLRALDLVEDLRQGAADTDARRDLLATIHSGELYSGLARTSWQFSQNPELASGRNPQAATWKDETLLYLEQGRARALLDLLLTSTEMKIDGAKLQSWINYMSHVRRLDEAFKTAPARQQRIVDELSLEMETGEPNIPTIVDRLEEQARDLRQVMRGAEHESDVASMYQNIPRDAVRVHINLSRDGVLLLGITSDGIQKLHTSEVTDIEVERTVLQFLQPFRHGRAPKVHMDLLAKISDWIIAPVADLIQQKEHVIFVPSRSLHKFPHSALLLDGQYLFLTKAVSAAPSLSSLTQIIQRVQPRNSLVAAVVAKPEKNGPDDTERDLPLAAMEALNLARNYGCTLHDARSLPRADFRRLFEATDILHIATHSLQSGASAWRSSITLQEPFRVSDMARLQSKAALIVFGACVSGLGDDTIGNDMLGFSHAVIASGALSFWGALWDVRDDASMILMVLFHRAVARREPHTSLAVCLRQAQVQLYELDTAGAIKVFEEIRDVWDEAERQDRIPPGFPRKPRNFIDQSIEDIEIDGVDYSNPKSWAPFVLIGHGGLIL